MAEAGQAAQRPSHRSLLVPADESGFVMVALLVAMAVSAVWMAALLPAWRQQAIREKEAELIFRGEAIARAIYLYRQERGGALPPDIETLVELRFLRKHYLDPITGEEFMPVAGATSTGAAGGGLQAGIIGVRSTSNDTSIRTYNNQQTYSQWAFDFTLEQMRAGGGLPAGVPGGFPVPDGGRRGGSPGGFDPITPPGLGPGGRAGRGGF
jgi:type II secretory pathway pseudopilin PulG